MSDEPTTIEYLIELAIESFEDYDLESNDLSDIIHEIADSTVPVYTSDLLDCASRDNALAVDVPELGPVFDGSPNPVNIIAANIYERILDALWDYANEKGLE